MIKSDETEVTVENVVAILNKALPYHWENRSEIQYLWYYYRGLQPILNREKQVRPEICNKIVENRANEIVSFKSGYLMGEPLQYVSRGNGDNLSDAINQLNEFVFAEEKPAKDKELADWFHICGTSFRMVLPDENVGEDDDSPFEIYTLDPRNTFVVYNNGLGNKPLLGVKYVVDDNGIVHYSCYSDHEYFEIVESHIIKAEPHILGDIPIIEYPLNIARIGAFELVIPLLDAINLTDSNRQDGVEQFIQALMLFHNVDISSDDYEKLREEGAIKFRDIDPQLKAEVSYTTVKSNVTTWASKVKDWFSNNSFGGVNSDTFSTFANNTIEGFRTKIGTAYTNTKTNVTTWASKVKEWFTNSSFGGVNSTNFQTFAGNVIEGFRTKVGSTYTTTKSNMVTWATNVKEWFTNSGFGGVNSANFQTFANNVVTGFKDKIGSAYVNTKSNMTTWATNVKNWFSGIASASAFSGFATSVVDGFKNRIGGYYTAAQGNMSTFGSSVKSWFTAHCSYNGFYNVASDVVSGFKNGIGELYHTCKSTISSWGSSIISWFKDKLDVNSPSKVFYEIGGFAVAGFNNAIAQVGKSTKSVVGTWADSFTNFSPTMALAVDTSALKYYDSAAFSRSISSNVQSSTEISATGFREAMEDFYHEYVEPTMVQMADDVRRQADKEEKTVVQVGNRVVTDAVTTQKKANGYSFTG